MNMNPLAKHLRNEINLEKNNPTHIRHRGLVAMHFRTMFDPYQKQRLVNIAADHGITLSTLIRVIFNDFIKQRERVELIRKKLLK